MYTFSEQELRFLLSYTIKRFYVMDGVYDFSPIAVEDTVEDIMEMTRATQAEDKIFKGALLEESIEPCPVCSIPLTHNEYLCFECGWVDDGDNVHEAALGLQPVA